MGRWRVARYHQVIVAARWRVVRYPPVTGAAKCVDRLPWVLALHLWVENMEVQTNQEVGTSHFSQFGWLAYRLQHMGRVY